MAILRLVSTGIALIAVFGCSSTSEPQQQTFDFTLRLTDDSIVYCPFGGCQPPILTSDTLTGRMTFSRRTDDLSAPVNGLGTIVEAFDDAAFADRATGKAVIDTDGIVTVALSPDPGNSNLYDYFTFTGKIENGRYSGRFTQVINGHTNAFGSFVTAP
jgi:hypothetical protein